MINRFISAVKAMVLCAAEWVTRTFEPYQAFTRPAFVKDTASLHDKAAGFERDLSDRFMIRSGEIINYRIPLPVGSPLDLGDQAIWHGIYTASEAFKVALGSDPERLTPLLRGLASHQPGGRLIRGLDEEGSSACDASNDSATGHLAGLYYVWKYGTADQRLSASDLTAAWASGIIASGNALANPDDTLTPFGVLAQGWKTDPLRASLLLALLRAAGRMTGSLRFSDAARGIDAQFGPMIPYPKARFMSWDSSTDTHRGAIHLAILADLYPANDFYKDGLRRLQRLARKQGNIWILALGGSAVGYGEGDRALAIKVLSEFSGEEKKFNPTRLLTKDPTIPKTYYGKKWVALQPLPKWQKTTQDFEWQRHPYALDSLGSVGDPPTSGLNGGDFLAAYRLGLLTGLLKAED